MTKNKKLLIGLGVIVVLVAVVIGIYMNRQQTAEEKVIRIGAILPLTGLAADMGHDCQIGIKRSVDNINQSGGILGKQLVVVFEDSKGTVKDGILCYQKLKASNVDFIICGLSNICLAILPLAEKDDKMIISTIAVAHNFPSASKNLFRVFLSADTETQAVTDFMINELKCKNISILRMDGDAGKDYSTLIRRNLSPFGVQIVAEEVFNDQTKDFANLVAKVLNVKCDAVYVFCNDKRLGNITRLILSKQIDLPIITTSAIVENKSVFSQLGNKKDSFEIYYPDLDLAQSYEKIGYPPTVCTVFSYDAIVLLCEAIKKANSTKVKRVLESFLQLHGVNGVVGTIDITSQGDVEFPLQIKKVK